MLHHPHSYKREEWPPMAMALGFFDGVHAGHQRVILSAKHIADEKGLKSAVMTFDPHPSVVLGTKHQHIEHITPLNEKKKIIAELGIDYLFVVRFTSDFAGLEPQQFVDQYIVGLNVQHVTAGFDYTYGRLGKGTMDTLKHHSHQAFTVTTIEKYEIDGEKVSSTRIRALLKGGEMEKAALLLGRFYEISGTVIHGDKRGREIGFATANIELNEQFIIPKTGVYAVKIRIKEQWYNGVCNLGYRPTFKSPDELSLSIEVHIFNFDAEIYGEEVDVRWYEHLRDEQKFNGIEELVTQINKDKQKAIEYFENLD